MKQIATVTRHELRQQMNRLGQARVPFLWGIDFAGQQGFIRENPWECDDILWEVRGRANGAPNCQTDNAPTFTIAEPVDQTCYETMFGTVMKGLLRGDSFLANLTVCTRVECSAPLHAIYAAAKAPYKLLIGDSFACFSPEPFVRITDGRISTYPMKGTIDAATPRAAETLLADYKELCEHYTIVDLMRNDLNAIARDVEVTRFRYIEQITAVGKTILQTSSEITGCLPHGKEYNFGDIIMPLLPAGSITGAPKEATVSLINQAEAKPRGWYTGVFGLFDGQTMDTAVMIRCIQRHADGALYFHSGGGITVNSNCADEYHEALTKICLPV